MQIDLAKLKADGQSYIDSVITKQQENAWTELKLSKFKDMPSDQVDIAKTIWSHGYMKGAEAATQLTMALYEVVNKKEA